MKRIISKIKKQHPQYLVWVLVILAILLNGLFTITTNVSLKTNVFNHFFQWLLSPFDNIRYGHYLAQKWFLVIIAFIAYIWWLKNQKISLKETIRKNLLPIGIIALASIITHFATYGGWFWVDDYRIISQYLGPQVNPQILPCCAHTYYCLGMIYLIIQWFSNNYVLYNTLGIIFNFLAGIGIFFLFNKFQKNKTLSLLTAIFFITTPTYYRVVWEIIEWTGNGFSLVLIILSFYLLISEFWPGAIIFAAAALEFGLGRTHFIILPLALVAIFFVAKNKLWSKDFLIKFGFLCSLPLIYIPVILSENGVPHSKPDIFVIAGSLVGVMVPHEIINPIARLLKTMKVTDIYVIPYIGISIVLILLIVAAWLFFRKKSMAAKFLIVGLSISLSSIIFPAIFGTQANRNIGKMVEYFTNPLPYTTTIYGLMPALGLAFIIAGLGLAIRFNIFKKVLIVLIILNTVTFIKSHLTWNKSYGYPHRKINSQLLNLLPANGLEKYIYVPTASNELWYDTRDFRQIYRAKEKYDSVNAPQAFVDLITKNKPPANQVYFMIVDKKFNITDLSEKIRNNYPNNITLQKLEELQNSK